jgi:hypothetical protein
MPDGNAPAIDSVSPGCRAHPRIMIVADAIVVLSASVMDTSMSVTGIAGPPAVNVAVASAPPPLELLASRSSAGGKAAPELLVILMNALASGLQSCPSNTIISICF